MGVTGLWRLIEPSGKPVPLETLENKVLAIDVSIWLHQAIKGFQDAQGSPLPNAHLLGIYHRVCKLLYFRIKPIFVFDGGVPNLKKETISKRNQQKSKKLNEAERIQKQLLTTLLKHSAVNKVLSEKAIASLSIKASPPKPVNKEKSEDIYKLPPTEFDSTLSSSEEESTSSTVDSSPTKQWDLHTIDEKSPHFKSLPADVRHEILTDLKETRKQSSWGRLHELPKQSDDFSIFQMKRLLKRYSVQTSLEEAEKEMGGRSLSLAELETLLKEQGVVTSTNSSVGRIASDENTKYLLIKDVKKAMDEARKQKELSDVLYDIPETEENEKVEEEEADNESEPIKDESVQNQIPAGDKNESVAFSDNAPQIVNVQEDSHNRDLEFQKDLEKAIQLSLHDVPSTSQNNNQRIPSSSKHNFSFLEDFTDADFQTTSESEEDICHQKPEKKLSSAKSYMMEYSGLTPSEIAKIISGNAGLANKNKINEIIDSKIERISGKNETTDVSTNKLLIEESEDTTVSSSTGSNSKVESVITNKSADSTEVSSSTNRLDASETGEDHTDDIETIEVMSDDASSDASNDFLEISEKQDTSKRNSPGFEIFVKPEDSLEDDIFSDIFSGKPKESEKESLNNISNVNTEVQPETTIAKKLKEILVTKPQKEDLLICNSEVINTNKKVRFNENVIENKEEHTKNVIVEFIKPLQEKSNISNGNKTDIQSAAEIKSLTTEQLEVIEENLRQEKEELIAEKSSKERMAGSLTDQIYQEAQELLQLFGVPFIIAPMEAEAQCAFLDNVNLTNGTITDDSDIWLFGGKTVYKNFFNQHKHVMEFRAENVQHNFKLTREQMILLALLVGSDYTVGIQGIGPVTALEVLAAFPPSKVPEINVTDQQIISGLEEFRKWLMGERALGPGRIALRNKLKNVTLTDSFPSIQVVKAYLEPTVDSSEEAFTWAKPDIPGLVAFARQKFGWTLVKSEEILKPVLKRLNETRIQRSIKDYFQTKHKIDSGDAENKMSKRVKKAVKRIGREPADDSDEEQSKQRVTRRQNQKNKKTVKSKKEDVETATADANQSPDDDANLPTGFSSDEDIQILKKTRTQSKKKLQQLTSEVKNEIEQQVAKKPRTIASLHKKDVIPQKEKNKVDALRSKMKAIEVFRKSKKGPGFLQKRKKVTRNPKEDAELSESSSD